MEVYLPWNNTWLELPPLPLLDDQVHRIEQTRIFSLNKDGLLRLYLLGGSSTLQTDQDVYTNAVWQLEWFNQSYHWIEDDYLFPPMGELHH